ncbi:hypothetical protein JXA85_08140 [Candidatus Woesearchaeota archaeon]|nr:hypothetical protein [Candidatus Woesearchaeota archaeon]
MMLKKGQGMPVNVIIIAAIALIILIVLVAIFSGKINIFSRGYSSTSENEQSKVCTARGGYCGNCGSDAFTPPPGNWIDCSPTQNCCK